MYGVKHVYKTRHELTRFTLLLPLLPLLFLLTPDNARATSTECLDLVYCVSSSLQPDEFLESVEVNTEVLIAPIQFTSQKEFPSLCASQLQRFYKRKKEFIAGQGPKPFGERAQESSWFWSRKSEATLRRWAWWPLLGWFLSSLKASECNKAVADSFLESQFDLVVNSSHCTTKDMCPGVTGVRDVLKCVGNESSSQTFFGLSTSVLHEGVADFLFTYSDNPIVVCDCQTLPARNFFTPEHM